MSKAENSAPAKSKLEETDVFTPRFGPDGLCAAIVADAASGEVLMLAYMNAKTLQLTLETGEAHFWSRSRQEIWRKGETSGNVMRVREMRTDCDQDSLLLLVTLQGGGVACHTGRRSCFYRKVVLGEGLGKPARLAFTDR